VPPRSQVVGDGTRRGEAALGRSGGLPPVPPPLPLARGLLRMLGAVVPRALWPRFHPGPHRVRGGAIAWQLVGDEHPGHVGEALAPLAAERLRGVRVPTARPQDGAPMPVLLHGPPSRGACARDRAQPRVHLPRVARPGTPPSTWIRLRWAARAAPWAEGVVRHEHCACQAPRFHITGAQTEAAVEPHAMADELGRTPLGCVQVG